MITPGENYYRLFEGKTPDYVPVFDMMPCPGYTPACCMAGPGFLTFRSPQGGKDPWGVTYISNPETNYSSMPQTWDYLLDDICDWRDIIKNPDYSNINWAEQALKDTEFNKNVFGIDRDQTLVLSVVSAGFFQDLMSFMGFTEGLCAMAVEPDEVKDLFAYLTEYYLELQHNIIKYYSPDAIYLLDDVAAQQTPFVSMDTFKELLLPYYKVLIDDAKDHGLPVQFHNCGRSEEQMALLFEAGVDIWDPVQTANDIAGMKAKYGPKKAFAGCWDWVPPSDYPNVDEEWIRQSVRECIDTYAPGGGFAMCGGLNVVGQAGDGMPAVIRGWMYDEIYKYGADYYKK